MTTGKPDIAGKSISHLIVANHANNKTNVLIGLGTGEYVGTDTDTAATAAR